tara:strand:- start:725 stop:1012 length:288 start_codon:yes stop_codon:yes gene_type:complete
MQLKPMNRHLLVEPVNNSQESEQNSHGILLPDEYKPKSERYCLVKLIDFASDCNAVGELVRGKKYIVDSTMIQSINYQGLTFSVVLENYIVARGS